MAESGDHAAEEVSRATYLLRCFPVKRKCVAEDREVAISNLKQKKKEMKK